MPECIGRISALYWQKFLISAKKSKLIFVTACILLILIIIIIKGFYFVQLGFYLLLVVKFTSSKCAKISPSTNSPVACGTHASLWCASQITFFIFFITGVAAWQVIIRSKEPKNDQCKKGTNNKSVLLPEAYSYILEPI